MTSRLLVMGCGHSHGVPLAGNDWVNTDPNEPRNRRTRASVVLQHDGCTLVIDTGPDFREQTIAHKIKQIDAVLYTHYHADHVHGIEDVRGWALRRNLTMPIYTHAETMDILKSRFDYVFVEKSPIYPVRLQPFVLKPSDLYQPIRIAGVPITVFEQDHVTCTSLGVRFGNVGYSTDMFDLPARSVQVLRGIDTWVVDGGSYGLKPIVHADLETVMRLNEKIGAKKLYLTHLSARLDYRTLAKELPKGYKPAHDGLSIKVTV
jgi:phosphoribosyl 1,2-cyclic phosphate phosphodiesterase